MAARKGDSGELAPFVVQNVEGLKEETEEAGHGAYGVIYNVTVNGLPYIAKRVHNALVKQVSKRESDSIKEKFRNECVTLSRLKHPNIVHFVGVHYGQDKSDITLIMERLHCDLSNFLKAHTKMTLPLKISILLDVTYGLLYLHTHNPPIVHRDLTARNVLVTPDGSAKIGDLGVAKLLSRQAQLAVMHTKAPGQPLYMPPEALKEKAECTPKIDIFSFGHLTLFTINEEAPDVFEVTITQESLRQGTLQASKRRPALDKVGQDHCTYPLITQCLHDNPTRRPNTCELNGKLKELSILHRNKIQEELQAEVLDEMLATEELESYKRLFEVAEEEGNRLRKQVGDFRSENESLTKRLDSTQRQLKLTQKEAFQASQDLTVMKNERERLELGRAESQLEVLQKKLKKTEEELAKAKKKKERKRLTALSPTEAVQRTLAQTEQLYDEAQEEISELRDENHELIRQMDTIKKVNKQLMQYQKSDTEPTESSMTDDQTQLRQTLEKQLHYSEMKWAPLQSPDTDNERLAVGTGNISQPPLRASDPWPVPSPLGNPPANTLGQAGYTRTPESVPSSQMPPQQYPLQSQSQPVANHIQAHIGQIPLHQAAGYVRQYSGNPGVVPQRRSPPLNQQAGGYQPHVVADGASHMHNAPQGGGGMYYGSQRSLQVQGQVVSDSCYGQPYQPHPSQRPQMDQLLQHIQNQQQEKYRPHTQQPYYPTGVANQELQNLSQSQWGTPYDQQQHVSRPSNVQVFQQQPNIVPSQSDYVATTPETPDVQLGQECTQPTNGSLVGVPYDQPQPISRPSNVPARDGKGPGVYHDEISRDGFFPLHYSEQPPSQIASSDYPAVTHPVPTPRNIPLETSTSTNLPPPPLLGVNLEESAGEEQFRNELQDNIDDEIEDVAAQVTEEGQSERHIVTSVQRPLDPNLICPMCMRQFRIGEIQKFRTHVKTCEGTKKDQEDDEGEGEDDVESTLI